MLILLEYLIQKCGQGNIVHEKHTLIFWSFKQNDKIGHTVFLILGFANPKFSE